MERAERCHLGWIVVRGAEILFVMGGKLYELVLSGGYFLQVYLTLELSGITGTQLNSRFRSYFNKRPQSYDSDSQAFVNVNFRVDITRSQRRIFPPFASPQHPPVGQPG
jgi:hypothetical protein